MLDEARERGRKEGYGQGFADGLRPDHDDGFRLGRRIGFEWGVRAERRGQVRVMRPHMRGHRLDYPHPDCEWCRENVAMLVEREGR